MLNPVQPVLFETQANPIPPGTEGGHVRDRGGKRIRYALVPTDSATPRGTVLVLPGRNEAIEKYWETARDLSRRGFCALILDWRGQGGSDRLLRDAERGYVQDFAHYVDDLRIVFDEVALPRAPAPFFVLGHSTGSLVALLAAPLFGGEIRRMVLGSALLQISGFSLAHPGIRRLSRVVSGMGLGRLYLGGGPRRGRELSFARNPLTHDDKRFARNVELLHSHPQLGLGGPTAAWVHAACAAIERVHQPEFISAMRIPTLFVAAGADRIVSSRAIEVYAPRLRAGALVTIDGASHELAQESDHFREQWLAAFDAFVPGT
ncbi:MAG: lysophospholipase [Mesorhizobium amorphae]|nr:MAG: lysophospholipase [Mesorhizobium amorphae]